MEENRNVPKLRFPGFDSEWEQRKVQDIYKITRGYVLAAPETDEVSSDEKPYPVYSSQTKNNGLMGYYRDYLYEDAITWTTDGANAGTVNYRPGKFYCTNVCGVLLSDEGYSNKCAAEALNSIAWKWVSHVGNPKLMNNVMGEIPITLPKSIEEQNQISKFFEQIDNLITLHQQKLEGIKEYKKGMLQKMFPKEEEKIPEIRFPGFSGDWEQRKLSDCAGFRRGSFPQPYGNREWYDGEGAMPFVQVADVADDMKLVDVTKQKISKVAQPMSVFADEGSVLVTLQGSIGRVAITQYGAFVDRTVLIFDKYNLDIDKTFWAYIIKGKFIDEAKRAPGGTIKTITKEALSDFDLMLPSYDEQKKLGAFLANIDNLITLHQRKIDELKELKKGLLQQMFV